MDWEKFKTTYKKRRFKKRTLPFGIGEINLRRLFFTILAIFFVAILSYIIIQYLSFDSNDLEYPTISSKVYDDNGELLFEISKIEGTKNTLVSYEDIPQACVQGIVATEDKTFWSNIGVDLNGLGRLGISLVTGGGAGGGSTISQQVIKNLYQTIYNRNPLDKLNEMILSVKLNQLKLKEEIVTMYLNIVDFGHSNYGIESASLDYFDKSVSELDLAECSYLVGIPQRPGIFNPYGDIDLGKERQETVLSSMVRDGYITEEEKNAVLSTELDFILQPTEIRAPHYQYFLKDRFGIMESGQVSESVPSYLQDVQWDRPMSIYTFYDYNLHKKVLDISQQYIKSNTSRGVNNSAIVILGKNGELKTMIGSVNYFNDAIHGNFNSALGRRQPGTSLNPLLYSLAFSGDVESGDIFSNQSFVEEVVKEGENQKVTISNFEEYRKSSLTAKESLQNNLVVPSVRILNEFGVDGFVSGLEYFGISKSEKENWCNNIALVEGCEVNLLEMTFAYHLIKENGNASGVSYIKWLEDVSGSVVYNSDEVVNERNFFDDEILQGVTEVSSILENERDESGWVVFTGDVRNDKDTMAFGFSDDYTVGIWVGNTQGQELGNVKAEDVAVPMLKEIVGDF